MSISRTLAVILMLLSTTAYAGDPAAGKQRATTCGACHGQNGKSLIPSYPHLAGQQEQYLVAALKAYRSGERKNMQMQPMAKGLSDTDIANLAAYYASLDPAGN